MPKKLTHEQFVAKSKKHHGDKYCYLEDYNIGDNKILIKCNICENTFRQLAALHMRGSGCPKCFGRKKIEKNKRAVLKKRWSTKKIGNKEIIDRAKRIHKGYYGYKNTKYENQRTKFVVTCPVHGDFLIRPDQHLSGQGCGKCKTNRSKISEKEFIKRAKLIHKNKYRYFNYKSINKKVSILCPEHGLFEQLAYAHVNKKQGCGKCAIENMRYDVKWFVKEARKIHNNLYDYSKTIFNGTNNKVKIVCRKHGTFNQRVYDHLDGHGCPRCHFDSLIKSTSEYITKARKVHNNFYDYSFLKYATSYKPVKIICPLHGPFWQRASSHLRGSGCPKCKSSRGELAIEMFLKKNGIKYEQNKRFADCVNDKTSCRLSYDFYIKNKNTLIEYDGIYHFKVVDRKNIDKDVARLRSQQHRDFIKNEYAERNKIKLIRIPYWKITEIKQILTEELGLEK